MIIHFVNILIYISCISLSPPEPFSGKVTYIDSYESNNPNITGAELEKLLGTKREFFIDDQFYKSIYCGDAQTIVLYRGDQNRIYRFKSGNDTIYWTDAAIDTLSTVIEFQLEKTEETILGLKCQKLRLVTARGVTTYYFNDKYAILPENFSCHKLDAWDFYTSTTKALPLKIIVEAAEITVTSSAAKIEKNILSEKTFDIPNGYLRKL